MKQRNDIWTYLIITAIAVLVWYWAAGETKVSDSLPPLRVEFAMPASASNTEGWIVKPESTTVTIAAEGSQRAMGRAARMRRLTVDLPPGNGRQSVDLFRAVRRHPAVAETGISVRSVAPDTIEVDVDTRETLSARVRPVLPRAEIVGEVVVDPPQVMISMPGRLRSRYPDDPVVEAFISRAELDLLAPDRPHTIENVALRLGEKLISDPGLTIIPPVVTLTFTLRSQIRELALEMPVRIKIAGAPEDSERVELDPKQLREVTISAPVGVITEIESGEAVVIALLHLKSSEKEAAIERKAVTCFMALRPDGTGVVVDGRVGDGGETRPVVGLTITPASENGS